MAPSRLDDEPLTATLTSAKTSFFSCQPTLLEFHEKGPDVTEGRLEVGIVGLHPYDDARSESTSEDILDIIKSILLTKLPGAHDKWEQGHIEFLATIGRFVRARRTVQMCLPAFPFKSANKHEKVLGVLPDKAEELSLRRLEDICVKIGKIYPPGAEILIISDGLVYSGKRAPTRHWLIRYYWCANSTLSCM